MNLLMDEIRSLFFKFLVPAVCSSVAVAIYSIVDSIVIGQGVGANGAAACAIVLPIFAVANFISLMCGIGGCVLRGKCRGEGREKDGNAWFTASLIYVIFLALVALILGNLYQEEFYRLCGADDVLLPYAADYGRWIFGFLPAFIFTAFFGCFIKTDGSPKFVMMVTLLGGVINIVLDIVFVFPMDMGMSGAGLATALGSLTQVSVLLVYLLRKKTSLRLVRPCEMIGAVRKISAVGFGSGLAALSMIVVSFIANNQIMHYCGASALAVYGMLSTITSLFISIFSGVGQSAQPIISENYGAKNEQRCRTAGNLGLKTALIFGCVVAAFCMAFPLGITGVFIRMTPEVAEIAPTIVRIYVLSFLPLALNIFITYLLQSVTEAKRATLISLCRGLVFNSLFLYLFPLIWGGNGIWWSIFAAEVCTSVIAFCYLRRLYQRGLCSE